MTWARLPTDSVKNANLVSLALALCAALVFGGCDREAAAPAAPAIPKTVADWFAIKVGDRTVRMELAVLPSEQEHGLMGRRDLGRDEGMLFVFHTPQAMSFWMHNTPTPLDIAYFTPEGALAEVYPAFPFDEKPLPSRNPRLQFVLEMNQGWYRDNGVRPGAQLDLPAVTAALKARGFEAREFGLGK
jgi:uncharacterized membrane protein (UPF0127 family)